MSKEITTGIQSIIQQLRWMDETMESHRYAEPLEVLNQATLGQHVRHIHDFYKALAEGMTSGLIDYNCRERNELIELSMDVALEHMEQLMERFENIDESLLVSVVCSEGFKEDKSTITSSLGRELMYGYDHAIHHLALIRIGFESVHPEKLPPYFGVACSTLSFQKKQ